MAYDEELAERVRAVLVDELDVGEKRMFGGLAFLFGGHMAVAVSGSGGLMVRVDPDEHDELVAHAGVEAMVMRGRQLRGWLVVDPAAVTEDDALDAWVGRGVGFVSTLPPKG